VEASNTLGEGYGDGEDDETAKQAAHLLQIHTAEEGLEASKPGSSAAATLPSQIRQALNDPVRGMLDTISMLMSRQLRGKCESMFLQIAEFFERFDTSAFDTDCALILQLRLNKDYNAPNNPVVSLYPGIDEIQGQACHFLDHMVALSQRFPRVDLRLSQTIPSRHRSSDFMGPCNVLLEDEIVQQAKKRVREALQRHWSRPSVLIAKYAEFAPLISGEADRRVAQALADRQQGPETARSLDTLSALCRDLEQMSKKVKAASTDLCYFRLYMVKCIDVKDILLKKIEALHQQIVEAVATDNREHMQQMGVEYQDIANQLVQEPTDSSELKALQDFCLGLRETLSRLTDQYCTQVYERVKFLLSEKFRISREDLQLFYSTYNWPYNIKMYMARSSELQLGRKKDLEMVLEGRQETLARELANTEKKVEKLFELGSLVPMEVQNMVKRITVLRESLEEAETEAESIEEQESLLGLDATDNTTKIREIKTALEPIEKLWLNVREYLELAHYWNEGKDRIFGYTLFKSIG